MLLHTKLINVFGSGDREVRIESQEIDCTRNVSFNTGKTKTLLEGNHNSPTIIACIEEEFDRLGVRGYEPYIIVNIKNLKQELHSPRDEVVKAEKHVINVFL